MTDKTVVLESPEYEAARQRLLGDFTVVRMAADMVGARVPREQMFHGDGWREPRFEFMQAANREYERQLQAHGLEESGPRHIGAVAETIGRLLEERGGDYMAE